MDDNRAQPNADLNRPDTPSDRHADGIKVTIMLEELLAVGREGAE